MSKFVDDIDKLSQYLVLRYLIKILDRYNKCLIYLSKY